MLQENSNQSVKDIADKIGLSITPCWRRINNLEENGVIKSRVAILDKEKLNLPLTAIVSIRTGQHDEAWFESFAASIQNIPEVIEFYRMSGEIDYMLRVVAPNMTAYDEIYKKIIKIGGMIDINSSFALEDIKCSTALPLKYAIEQ